MAISLTSFSDGSLVYCSTAIILTLAFDVDVSLCVYIASFRAKHILYECRIAMSREINLCHTHAGTNAQRGRQRQSDRHDDNLSNYRFDNAQNEKARESEGVKRKMDRIVKTTEMRVQKHVNNISYA